MKDIVHGNLLCTEVREVQWQDSKFVAITLEPNIIQTDPETGKDYVANFTGKIPSTSFAANVSLQQAERMVGCELRGYTLVEHLLDGLYTYEKQDGNEGRTDRLYCIVKPGASTKEVVEKAVKNFKGTKLAKEPAVQ